MRELAPVVSSDVDFGVVIQGQRRLDPGPFMESLADAVRARGGHVLVIGAERMTDLLDVEDRSTAMIFGDGAGAVVVSPTTTQSIGPVVWGADGGQWDAVT